MFLNSERYSQDPELGSITGKVVGLGILACVGVAAIAHINTEDMGPLSVIVEPIQDGILEKAAGFVSPIGTCPSVAEVESLDKSGSVLYSIAQMIEPESACDNGEQDNSWQY